MWDIACHIISARSLFTSNFIINSTLCAIFKTKLGGMFIPWSHVRHCHHYNLSSQISWPASVSPRACRMTSPRYWYPHECMRGQKNAMLSGITARASLYLFCHNVAWVSSLAKISAMFAHRRHNLALRSFKNDPSFSSLSAILSCSILFFTASSMFRWSDD